MDSRRHSLARVALVSILVLVLLSVGFAGGLITGATVLHPSTASIPTSEPSAAGTPEPASFNVFWQAWNLVQQHYVDRQAVNATKLTYGAIDGMLAALGDVGHTRFLTPAELQAENQSLAGQLEGIGAEVTIRDGQITIVAPLPGTPAQKAGIRPGDVIVRINGQDATNLSLDDAISKIRGPAGTSVTLTVMHPGQTTLTTMTIVREKLTVPSVMWARLPGTTVAQVLITDFSANTTQQLVDAIKAARADGATGFILDLRNDPGGLLDEAVGVASQFVGQGNVFLEQNAQGQRTPVAVKPGGTALDVPLVVLVNDGTASAAEIVAGAIQDHQRAEIVGTTTFGTGTVLSQYKLSDGSAVLLGTEEWLTPDGHQIWHNGITPTVTVALPDNVIPLTPPEVSSMTAEQLKSTQDTQLLRALQILSQPAG